MTHEKRVLVAFALSFLMMILWRALFPPPPPEAPEPTAESASSATTYIESPKLPAPSLLGASVGLPIRQGSQAREITVENDLYRIVFSTEGAVVKNWILKGYSHGNGDPLDAVNGVDGKEAGYPLRLSLESADLTQRANRGVYVAAPSLNKLRAPTKLTFEFSDGAVQVKKVFSFDSTYVIGLDTQVFDGRLHLAHEIHWSGGLGDHQVAPETFNEFSQIIYGSSTNPSFTSQGSVDEVETVPGPLDLAGMADRYFAGIFLPASRQSAFQYRNAPWEPPDWTEEDKPEALAVALARRDHQAGPLRLFVGPKDLAVLRTVEPSLEKIVDFGWFSFIAQPLFLMLRFTHDHIVSNYGWAIALVTLVINLALFPLKLKSLRSAQAMQKVSPQVKVIQERYKHYKFNDSRKQRMNQEVMALYKQHGVNPLGGCLPMLVQMPFLFGFYKVLYVSIELRQAPFAVWIRDLSIPDPLYILPSAMIVTMFILQKMTPMTTADPAQQRMMMLMPLFFGFFFFQFPSGLVLYWLVGNLVGIAQQMFINRFSRTAQPAPVDGKKIATSR